MSSIGVLDPSPLLGAASLPAVAMGFLDSLVGDDDGEGDGSDGDDDDALFEDDAMGGDDPAGGGDGGDDAFGDLGDVDEDFGDDLDAVGGGGDDAADLEPRVEELEDELASISSTVSTVRSENEEMAETVEGIEENVRKLLDVYEMVTRGVNPFVDESAGGGFDSDSFGLFEDDGGDDDPGEEVDDEIMDAKADSFFDDDFDEGLDGDFEDDLAGGGADDGDVGTVGGEPFDDADGSGEEGEGEGGEDGDGKTFEELKAEYDSGEADWDDEALEADDGDVDGDAGMLEKGVDDGSDPESEIAPGDGVEDEPLPEGEPGEPRDEETPEATEVGSGGIDHGSKPDDEDRDRGGAAGEKPYLETLPEGYSSDLLVLEWMGFLRDHADVGGTIRAIDYYRSIEWISDDVADDLEEVVAGLDPGGAPDEVAAPDGGRGVPELSIDHHTRSLEYIRRLDGGRPDGGSIGNWSFAGGG